MDVMRSQIKNNKEDIDCNKETLKEHEKRLTTLEVSDGRIITMVENLVKAVDGLVTWIKGLVGAIALSGIGFIIWYIQSL